MSSDLVVPGDELGVIEEYAPACNVYVDELGVLRARVVGRPSLNAKRHEAGVVQVREVLIPRQGDAVQAVVAAMRDAVVHLDIIYNKTRGVHYAVPFRGVLHISEVSDERVESMYSVFGYGDVVMAKVISSKPPYQLSTRGLDFGVVLARCPRCMTPLKKVGLWLRCPNCRKNFRRKKVSRHYTVARETKGLARASPSR